MAGVRWWCRGLGEWFFLYPSLLSSFFFSFWEIIRVKGDKADDGQRGRGGHGYGRDGGSDQGRAEAEMRLDCWTGGCVARQRRWVGGSSSSGL